MVNFYRFLKKHGVAMGFGLGALIVLLTYVIIFGGYPEGNPDNATLAAAGAFNFGLFAAYFLFFLCCAVSVIFPVIYMAKNFKESRKALLGIAGIFVIFLICYFIGSTEMSEEVKYGISIGKISPISDGQMQLIDGFIFMGYAMLILGIIAIIFANVKSFGKS